MVKSYETVKVVFGDKDLKFEGYEYIAFIKLILEGIVEFYGFGKPEEVNSYIGMLAAKVSLGKLIEKKAALEEIIK